MAIPDMWIKILKEVQDDSWDMANICFTLTNQTPWREDYCLLRESRSSVSLKLRTSFSANKFQIGWR